MSFLPNSYQEMLVQACTHSNHQNETIEIFKRLSLQGMALHAQAPVFYVVDYSQKKYLYIDPSCEQLLGYDLNILCDAGPLYFTGLWHPNDFKCFNEQIFPEIIAFLKNQTVSDYPKFSFSFNYRVKTKDGEYLKVLQRSTYFGSHENGCPIAAIGYIIDISAYKPDSSMVHTIEEIGDERFTLAKIVQFKSIHYPDKFDKVLSKREIEILQFVEEGFSSKQIAARFSISLNTVSNHRKNMLMKTKSRNCTELLSFAKKHGLL